jgi:hypothetical protein
MPYKQGGTSQGNSGRPEVVDVYFSNNVNANNVPIALHKPPGVIAGGVYVPVEGFQYEQFHAQLIIDAAGIAAAYDDPEGQAEAVAEGRTYGDPAADALPSTNVDSEDQTPAAKTTGVTTSCKSFASPINYDERLTTNFAIRSLSVGAAFPHDIVAQNGLTVPEILCNLQALAENVLEPLRVSYPGFRINSGFRKGTSSSQHNKGMACDLQWPGLTPAGYTDIAEWMRSNLPFDQLIFEHGKSIWIHVSYNRTSAAQRGMLLTYYPRETPNYKPGLKNHYA